MRVSTKKNEIKEKNCDFEILRIANANANARRYGQPKEHQSGVINCRAGWGLKNKHKMNSRKENIKT